MRYVYKTVMEEIFTEFTAVGYRIPIIEPGPDDIDDGSYLGSPLYPALNTVRRAIKRLKAEIRRMFPSTRRRSFTEVRDEVFSRLVELFLYDLGAPAPPPRMPILLPAQRLSELLPMQKASILRLLCNPSAPARLKIGVNCSLKSQPIGKRIFPPRRVPYDAIDSA